MRIGNIFWVAASEPKPYYLSQTPMDKVCGGGYTRGLLHIRALYGGTDRRVSQGRTPMTWIEYVLQDLHYLSALHGVGHTLIGCH